ncbi:MAG: copper amine oxidase N-terminal domain-containing protein, partial [Firmicutes bacterium]|nr:copper amine oxidase N-terminal domain-containing protein [Bacillota bacterium]
FLSSGFTDIEEAVINTIFKKIAGPPKPVTRIVTVAAGDSKMVVNGRNIFYPVLPETKAGVVFVPAITLADALEAKIEFDENTGTLTLSVGDNNVRAKIGETYLEVNNGIVPMETATYFKDSFIMLPLLKAAESLGASATYSFVGGRIIITLMK